MKIINKNNMINTIPKSRHFRFLLCVTMLFIAGISTNNSINNSNMPNSLTIVTPEHERITSALSPFGHGFDRDLIEEFKKFISANNLSTSTPNIIWRTAKNTEQAIDLITKGKADIAVGFTNELHKISKDQKIVYNYKNYKFGPNIYPTNNVEVILPKIEQINNSRTEFSKNTNKNKVFANFDANTSPTILDLNSWHIWKPFVKDFSANSKLYGAGIKPTASYNWIWTKNNSKLMSSLHSFWEQLLDPNNKTLEHLQTRYYSYFPNTVEKYELSKLYRIIKERLPIYTNIVKNAAHKANIDPLLLVAVIMQESRFKENMTSYTGVQGIMQLTKRTAHYLNVDRLNPNQAIHGGARYLNMIWENLEDENLEKWDRWFFALAAFNQGPTRINGAIALSKQLGETGKTWLELKKVLPLLSQKKYASMIGQSTGRGGEAVKFVERVRWYYHILQGVVTLGHPEAQNLAPLLLSPTS